jgi:hypothetical protein
MRKRAPAARMSGASEAHLRPVVRPSISKLVATVEDLDDGAIDDVTRAVKLIGVGRRRPATTR